MPGVQHRLVAAEASGMLADRPAVQAQLDPIGVGADLLCPRASSFRGSRSDSLGAVRGEAPEPGSDAGRFDGFHSVPASVSNFCLLRFDNDRYSVSAHAIGRPVERRLRLP
jgi:hypothetical protein